MPKQKRGKPVKGKPIKGKGRKMAMRENQKSVFLQPDVMGEFDHFKQAYPHARISDIVNASLREYLRLAKEKGVDGNLRPLVVIEGSK